MFYSFLPLLHVNTQSAIRSGLVLKLLARSIWVQSTLWCCDAVFHTPAQCPLVSPLSWSPPPSRLRRSPEVVHLHSDPRLRLRRQWLSVGRSCYWRSPRLRPNIISGMTAWQSDCSPLLSQLPSPAYPAAQIDQNGPICLCHRQLFCLFTQTYSRHVLTSRIDSEKLLLSLTHQNCKKCLWKFSSRILSKLDQTWEWHWEISDIFYLANLHQKDVQYLLFTAAQFYFTSCVKIYDWIIWNVYRWRPMYCHMSNLGNIDIP